MSFELHNDQTLEARANKSYFDQLHSGVVYSGQSSSSSNSRVYYASTKARTRIHYRQHCHKSSTNDLVIIFMPSDKYIF